MNSISAVSLAVVAALLIVWGATSLQPERVKIVPAPARSVSQTLPPHAEELPKSEALENLGQLSRPNLDRALFLKSFASAR